MMLVDIKFFTTTKEKWECQTRLIFLPCYSAEVGGVVPCLHPVRLKWQSTQFDACSFTCSTLNKESKYLKYFFCVGFLVLQFGPNDSDFDVSKWNDLFNTPSHTYLHDPLVPQHHLIFSVWSLMHIPERLPSLLSHDTGIWSTVRQSCHTGCLCHSEGGNLCFPLLALQPWSLLTTPILKFLPTTAPNKSLCFHKADFNFIWTVWLKKRCRQAVLHPDGAEL